MSLLSKIATHIRQSATGKSFGTLGLLALSIDFLVAGRYRTKTHPQNIETKAIVEKAVKSIQETGFYAIENFFDAEDVERLSKSLQNAIDNNQRYIHPSTPYDKRIHGVEHLDSNFDIFSKHPLLLEIANIYLQEEAKVAFTLGAILESSIDNPGSGGGWHRDNFTRQFKAMVYLSDVDSSHGPFQIIEKSHHLIQTIKDNYITQQPYKNARFTDDAISLLLSKTGQNRIHTLTAKAGTVLLFDSSTIHRGAPIQEGVRAALTNYFYPSSVINVDLYQHFSPVAGHAKM
jgi:ectoine hydroxylase-related dioxygenase (phytanoyl-CoA dioxygenase family)